MIKNIVFDVGNVLVKWTPEMLSAMLFDNEHDAYIAANNVFRSPFWPQLDLMDDDLDTIKNRMKNEVEAKDYHIIDETIDNFAKYVPVYEETNNWAIKMKKKGYKLYIITNFPPQFIDTYNRLLLTPYLDGYVCSSDLHIVKPDVRIYNILCEKYDLKPEECIFIDDLKVNTDGALNAGFGRVLTFNGDVKEMEDLNL